LPNAVAPDFVSPRRPDFAAHDRLQAGGECWPRSGFRRAPCSQQGSRCKIAAVFGFKQFDLQIGKKGLELLEPQSPDNQDWQRRFFAAGSLMQSSKLRRTRHVSIADSARMTSAKYTVAGEVIALYT